MIKATAIDHINMTVKDLEESIKFYHDLFGFIVLKEQLEENSKIIGDASVKLCLYEGEDAGDRKGIAHFGLNVEDFPAAVARCKELGVTILYGGELEWENSRSLYIEDPNGYHIELSEVAGGGL